MGEHFIFEKPRWLRDLVRFLPLKSQFVLTGNVRDLQIAEAAPGTFAAVPLAHLLHKELKAAEYGATLVYDLVNGFSHVGETENDVLAARQVIQRLGAAEGSGNAPGLAALIEALSRLPALEGPPVALIVDFASRLLVRGDAMSDSEHRLFTNALIQSHRARSKPVGAKKIPPFNTIIWIAEREGNLPDWLIIDNPCVRHIPVAKPDNQARSVIAPQLLRYMPDGANLTPDTIRTSVREFVEQTEGLLLLDLAAISQLARRENISVTKIGNAVRNYKVGVTEDPWLKIPKDKIRDGEAVHQSQCERSGSRCSSYHGCHQEGGNRDWRQPSRRPSQGRCVSGWPHRRRQDRTCEDSHATALQSTSIFTSVLTCRSSAPNMRTSA